MIRVRISSHVHNRINFLHKKNGDLFFHIVNCAGLLIDLHEYQKLEDTPIGNENVVEWSEEKFNRVQEFIKNNSDGQRPS